MIHKTFARGGAVILAALSGVPAVCSAQGDVASDVASAGVAQESSARAVVAREDAVPARALLSEVRTFGPLGAEDSFVEVRSALDEPLDLSGWSLQFQGEGGEVVSVPVAPSTVLRARGHLLFAGKRFSLGRYARPDVVLPEAIVGGVRLRDEKGRVVDAVGPEYLLGLPRVPEKGTSQENLFREGRGMSAWAFENRQSGAPVQFSVVRRRAEGQAVDFNDNHRDWIVVSVSGALGARKTRLGAPGPQNRGASRLALQLSPPRPEQPAGATTVSTDPVAGASVTGGAQTPRTRSVPVVDLSGRMERAGRRRLAPLRTKGEAGTNRRLGTMVLRHRLVNNSSQTLKKFRLQVVGATSGAPLAGIADVRLLPLPAALKAGSKSNQAGVGQAKSPSAKGLAAQTPIVYGSLEEPPTQARGGGMNSSLLFDVASAGGSGGKGIAPGQPVEIRILLGVEQAGRYRLALEGGALWLSFDGHTEGRTPAEATFSWGLPSRSATSTGSGTRTSGLPSTSASGGARSGGARQGQEPEDVILLAAIVVEGNTEDAVTEPQDTPVAIQKSPLGLSSSDIVGGNGAIRLRFAGSLDAASAEEASNFVVEVNGQVVAATPSNVGQNTIVLRLAEGALRPGDRIVVRWDNLRDARGRVVSGQVGPITVPR